MLAQGMDDLRRAVAPIRDISNIAGAATGKSLQQVIAEKAGVTNLENSTQY